MYKRKFLQVNEDMNYKKDKEIDTIFLKVKEKMKKKLIKIDKKVNPFNKLLTLNIK